MQLPPIGCTRDDLDTPCLLIDLDAMERNIRRMVEYCRSHGVAWRPHAKSYKSSAIGRKVVEAGAIGLTCAKLGEAEVMADGGVRDLLIANPLVGRQKLARLVALRRRADPIVVVDHSDQVRAISEGAVAGNVSLRTLVEVDIGMNRCGVGPGEPAVALARQISNSPGLQFAGIMGWEGHLVTVADPAEKTHRVTAALVQLRDTCADLERSGFASPIVSAGGTGSFQITARLGIATEIQAGGGIFMDLFYRNKCQVAALEYALTILATVTSRPTATRAIIDAGRKTMNQELCVPEVRGRTDLRVQSLSAEHGVLEVTTAPGPAIGERIELFPGYGDFTTVLHDRIYAMRAGRLEVCWPLDARGRLD
jgi:D-serine deaminase-like pyridoxal phosphate-dependent protein